jgi:primase-polymerase (primpol)-like protein
MNKYLVKKAKTEVEEADEGDIEPSAYKSPFISFRYSYTSISSSGGKTHIKAKGRRFENGKFDSEEFEGTMNGSMYNNAVKELQDNFLNQVSGFYKNLLSFLLPLK